MFKKMNSADEREDWHTRSTVFRTLAYLILSVAVLIAAIRF